MKKIVFCLLFVSALISCTSQQEIVNPISTATTMHLVSQEVISTIFPTKTLSPTLPPPATVPVATLNAVATLDALRIDLLNQMPELEKYGVSCYLYDCSGIEISPNGQYIIITNGNIIELFNIKSQRIGTYSFYDIYGHLVGFSDGYVSVVHWSNDGRYLYITTQFGDGGPEAYFGYKSSLTRVNLENGTWKDTGISGLISFSPDEKYIAYSANDSEIRVRNLQSGEENTHFTTDYYLYFGNFVWSPDSKKIIFVATAEDWYTEDAKFALHMIDLENKGISNLHETSFPFYYPISWTETNKVALNNFQEFGEWVLDLSVNPPIIKP